MATTGGSIIPITLILGGARSGKGRRAEALAEASGLPVVYVATTRGLKGMRSGA
jgi:adenosylcobinamide kinase/adenosylcobinamide-phosphate guanylyltransferase